MHDGGAGALKFWWRWLMLAAVLVVLTGAALMLLPGLTQQLFNLLYFGAAQAPASFSPAAVHYVTFICGVLGAVMVGWGATLLYLVAGPFKRGVPDAWKMVTLSLLVWFLPDTALSIWMGFWHNTLLNGAFLVLFGVPLAATYRQFNVPAARRTTGVKLG
jgi:hypothetical protein